MAEVVTKADKDSNIKNHIYRCPFQTPQESDSNSKNYSSSKDRLSSKDKEKDKEVSEFDFSIQVR